MHGPQTSGGTTYPPLFMAQAPSESDEVLVELKVNDELALFVLLAEDGTVIRIAQSHAVASGGWRRGEIAVGAKLLATALDQCIMGSWCFASVKVLTDFLESGG